MATRGPPHYGIFHEISHLLPKGERVDLILTTRVSDDFPGYGQIPLDVLAHDSPHSPAVDLLLQEAGQWNADAATREAAQRLAADLGGLPLALIVAGALARDGTGFDTLRDRIGELVEARPSLGNDYPDSVAAAVRLSLDSLDADARRLADLCAWLDPDRITKEVFTAAPAGDNWAAVTEDIPEEAQALLADPERVRAALRTLRQRSLLQPGETGLSLHRLTAEVLRRDAPDPHIPAHAAAAILAADYPYDADDPDHWQTCRRLTPHVVALWGNAETLWCKEWGQPGWHAMDFALSQSGLFLNKQSDFRGAEVVERAALELMERRVDAADRDLPLALGNLSLTLGELMEFPEAAEKIDRAIALDETHRPDSAELAARYMQKVNLYIRRAEAGDLSELDAAEPWITEAREIWERQAAGEPSPKISLCWNKLGYLRRLQGRKPESAEAAQKALDIRRQVPGVNRHSLATSAMNVGASWLEAGAPDTAAPLLREAHEIRAEIFDDPQNPALQNTTAWLVVCLLTLVRAGHDPARNRAEAEALCETHGLDWDVEQRRAAQYPTRPDEGGAG